MNAIAKFRLCTLTDEELLKKVDTLTDNLFVELKVPFRHIPAKPNDDYDLLIGELILRFISATPDWKYPEKGQIPEKDGLFFCACKLPESEANKENIKYQFIQFLDEFSDKIRIIHAYIDLPIFNKP